MIPIVPRSQIRPCKGQSGILLISAISTKSTGSVRRFEERVAEFCGAGHAVAFSSGRSAFGALLKALDYPRDSIVLMPSLNYPAMPLTVEQCGLRVLWVPMSEKKLTPDFDKLEASQPGNAVALVWPNYFGSAGPMDEIRAYCGGRGLDLIEDSAHSLGAYYKGIHVGNFGRASIFSFETSKIVNTLGGGVVVTNDGAIHGRLLEIQSKLSPKSKFDVVKSVLKSYVSAAMTSTWGATLCMYPALAASRELHDELVNVLG
ncbi:MAG TPA: aminotransferase class I/II-fold pyridoxal phosphate-dependent enzyme, partial [bacterium]|nr:aminotransferase class I/II-fold pyridoxal phosphate-dependent enzyme [bacterium]